MSESDRRLWMDAMDGREPVSTSITSCIVALWVKM